MLKKSFNYVWYFFEEHWFPENSGYRHKNIFQAVLEYEILQRVVSGMKRQNAFRRGKGRGRGQKTSHSRRRPFVGWLCPYFKKIQRKFIISGYRSVKRLVDNVTEFCGAERGE